MGKVANSCKRVNSAASPSSIAILVAINEKHICTHRIARRYLKMNARCHEQGAWGNSKGDCELQANTAAATNRDNLQGTEEEGQRYGYLMLQRLQAKAPSLSLSLNQLVSGAIQCQKQRLCKQMIMKVGFDVARSP